MDTTLLTTCRYTGKTRVVGSNESEFRYCRICGGYTDKTVGSDRKTVYDLTVDNAVSEVRETISADNLLHQEQWRCSHCGEPVENYDAIEALITSSQTLHDSAVEGVAVGEYAVGSKATFQTAIDAAQAVVTADDSTQAEITTATSTLQTAKETFEAGIVT